MAWLADLVERAAQLRRPLAWALSLALFALCLAARFALEPWISAIPFITFFLAVAGAAILGGWGPALVVLGLSVLSSWFFFLPPYWSFNFKTPDTFVIIFVIIIVNLVEIALINALVSAASRLRSASRMQQTLFRELQHRVANNMQVVASILHHAGRGLDDPVAVDMLDDAEARIIAMAQLHRRLYEPDAYTKGLAPLLQELLADQFQGLRVAVRLDIRHEALSLSQMTAISLLVSEAATNAAKHVFRPAHGKSFEVSPADGANGRLRLCIHDDGPGIAPKAPDTPKARGMGMGIMEAFARQLGGSLTVESGKGTTLSVEFSPDRDGAVAHA